ncbi:hypothetical protein RA989_21575, partial [Mycobacteroides abscessus subsp. massiliense]
GTTGETLTIRHDSIDRSSFAPGARPCAICLISAERPEIEMSIASPPSFFENPREPIALKSNSSTPAPRSPLSNALSVELRALTIQLLQVNRFGLQ